MYLLQYDGVEQPLPSWSIHFCRFIKPPSVGFIDYALINFDKKFESDNIVCL